MRLQTLLALAMALLLMANLRGAGLFLYLWAIPLGISDLASGVVWLSIFTDRGYINSLLAGLGLSESGRQTAPLGRAVIGGLVAATVSTLFILPSIYAIVQKRSSTASPSLNPYDPESKYYEKA